MTTANEIHQLEAYAKDQNCCAVLTMAVVCDISFQYAQQIMRTYGRKDGQGTFFHKTTRPAIESLGFTVKDITNTDYADWRRHYKVQKMSQKSLIKYIDPKKTYLCRCNGHIYAIVNGEVQDTITRKHGMRIKWLYEVTRNQ